MSHMGDNHFIRGNLLALLLAAATLAACDSRSVLVYPVSIAPAGKQEAYEPRTYTAVVERQEVFESGKHAALRSLAKCGESEQYCAKRECTVQNAQNWECRRVSARDGGISIQAMRRGWYGEYKVLAAAGGLEVPVRSETGYVPWYVWLKVKWFG